MKWILWLSVALTFAQARASNGTMEVLWIADRVTVGASAYVVNDIPQLKRLLGNWSMMSANETIDWIITGPGASRNVALRMDGTKTREALKEVEDAERVLRRWKRCECAAQRVGLWKARFQEMSSEGAERFYQRADLLESSDIQAILSILEDGSPEFASGKLLLSDSRQQLHYSASSPEYLVYLSLSERLGLVGLSEFFDPSSKRRAIDLLKIGLLRSIGVNCGSRVPRVRCLPASGHP